jgi:hypothetical protein
VKEQSNHLWLGQAERERDNLSDQIDEIHNQWDLCIADLRHARADNERLRADAEFWYGQTAQCCGDNVAKELRRNRPAIAAAEEKGK